MKQIEAGADNLQPAGKSGADAGSESPPIRIPGKPVDDGVQYLDDPGQVDAWLAQQDQSAGPLPPIVAPAAAFPEQRYRATT